MLDVDATIIGNALPFGSLERIGELLSFEGAPLLLHFRDDKNYEIIAYWVDFDSSGQRWLYGKIKKKELFDYLIGGKSLRCLLTEISSDYLFLLDVDVDDNITSVRLLNSYSIPSKYLPKDDSYYLEGLTDFYEQYLNEFSYLQRLRENSYIFKVESTNKSHSDTVGAREAALVLNGAANSIEGYIKVIAFNLLKNEYGDASRINKRINKVKNRLSPRISQTAYNSFEVWLAIDTLTWHGEDKIDSELRRGIVEGYKKDVLDVDFSDEEDARIISSKYTLDERKIIYEPLLKLFDNSDLNLSISDYKHKINRRQEKIILSEAFKEIILPKPTLEEVQNELNKKNIITLFIFSLKEGEDITKLRKQELLNNLVFKEDLAESPFNIESPIEIDGRKLELKKPLRFMLKVDTNGNLQLYNSELELYGDGKDIQQVTNNVKRQFLALYDRINDLKDKADPMFEELNNYLKII